MTDAPFPETHRATLEKLRDDDQLGVPVNEPVLVAIDAALAEIDRLTKENEGLRVRIFEGKWRR